MTIDPRRRTFIRTIIYHSRARRRRLEGVGSRNKPNVSDYRSAVLGENELFAFRLLRRRLVFTSPRGSRAAKPIKANQWCDTAIRCGAMPRDSIRLSHHSIYSDHRLLQRNQTEYRKEQKNRLWQLLFIVANCKTIQFCERLNPIPIPLKKNTTWIKPSSFNFNFRW